MSVRTAQTLLSAWEWVPLPALVLLGLAGCYVVATARVDHLQPFQPWPRRQTAWFLAGIAALWVAILGPPGSFDDVFFYAHMSQHILLTMVAAPLLVLGDPILLSLRVAPRSFRKRWLVPLYRGKTVQFLTHPVTGWLLFVGVMAGSHIPAVYDYALSHPFAHDYVEHPLYVTSALLYFYPLLAASPGRHSLPHGIRVLSLFTMMVPMAMIGFFIYAAPQLGYPFYAHVSRPFGPAPFQDQQLSGAIMWSSTMAFGALWLCVAGLRWLHAEERRSHSVDRAIARSLTGGRKPVRRRLWT
jgi:putative copper resistance protein D